MTNPCEKCGALYGHVIYHDQELGESCGFERDDTEAKWKQELRETVAFYAKWYGWPSNAIPQMTGID